MGQRCHSTMSRKTFLLEWVRFGLLVIISYLNKLFTCFIVVKILMDQFTKGERVVQDFNIQKEAHGSKRALVKLFETNVTNTNIDIHFKWAGKGTCCIPFQSTFGPLVSAIHVSQGLLTVHTLVTC